MNPVAAGPSALGWNTEQAEHTVEGLCCQEVSLQPRQSVGPASSVLACVPFLEGALGCSMKQLWSKHGVLGPCVRASSNRSSHSLDTFSSMSRGTKALLEREMLRTESCWLMLTEDGVCVNVYLSPNRSGVW